MPEFLSDSFVILPVYFGILPYHVVRWVTVLYFNLVPHILSFEMAYSQERSQYLVELNIYLIIRRTNTVFYKIKS